MKTEKNKNEYRVHKIVQKHIAVLMIILCLLNFGCVSLNVTNCPAAGGGDFLLDGTSFRNADFKIGLIEQSGLLPTRKFWFASNDDRTVTYGWDEIVVQNRAAEVEKCNYQFPTSRCVECEICSTNCTNGENRILGITQTVYAELTETSANQTASILKQFTAPREACNRLYNAPNMSLPTVPTPKDNAIYRFQSKNLCSLEPNTEWELQTFVVPAPRTVRQSMEVYTDAADPAIRFRFKMPLVNGLLRENFSPNLQVSKVRILLGVRDPHTGKEMILEDADALRRMRPSKILFLPDLVDGNINDSVTENANRCFIDPTKDDGGFDLKNSCLRNLNGGHVSQNVTPTYQIGRNTETLDWVIEYKTTEGLPSLPTFENGVFQEFPVIEWTIE